MEIWVAPDAVQQMVKELREKNHLPRLEEARVVVCFDDSKPFKKNRFNWGTTRRVPPLAKLFANGNQYDFMIQLSRDAYEDILSGDQRLALLDLRLECCQVDYVPQVSVVDGKKKVDTDDWGRVIYTDEVKRDKDGQPVWKVVPLDLISIQANIKRFGCWCEDMLDLREVMGPCEATKEF